MSGKRLRALAREVVANAINGLRASANRAMTRCSAAAMALWLAGFAGNAVAVVPPLGEPNVPILRQGSIAAAARQPDGGIIVGGSFTSVNGVARSNLARLMPDGTLDPDWAPVVEGGVEAIAIDASGNVYVGGSFQFAGAHQFRSFLAKFSGSGTGALDASWAPAAGGDVHALVIGAGGAIYAGGDFQSVGSSSRNHIAKIQPGSGAVDSTWNPGADASVNVLAFDGTNIYAGGAFANVGGQARSHLARMSATGAGAVDAWNPSADQTVSAIAFAPAGDVYVGGSFQSIGGSFRSYVAKLSASTGVPDATWRADADGTVASLAVDAAGAVYIGGWFQHIRGASHPHLVRASGTGAGTVDATFSPAIDGAVQALVFDAGGTLHAGGSFGIVDGQTRFALAGLAADGTLAGAAVDAESRAFVDAIARQPDGALIVGGEFGKAGQVRRDNILRIDVDGSLDPDWNPGANGPVEALLSGPDGTVYAGGLFTTIGGVPRNYIAKLAGGGSGAPDAAWNPNASYEVTQLAWAPDEDLVVGGSFQSIGGLTQRNVAKIAPDGSASSTWRPTVDGLVRALAVDGAGAVYIGGDFNNAGGFSRMHTAKIDGDTGLVDPGWNAPADNLVLSLAAGDDGAVYVGGSFTTIAGVPRQYLARLDGMTGAADSFWDPAPDSWIWTLTTGSRGVFASGTFTQIAGVARANLARLDPASGEADPDWAADPNGQVNAMTVDTRGVLYIGGSFDHVGGVARIGVAALPSAPVENTTLTITSIDPEPSHAGEPYTVSFRVDAAEGMPTGIVTVSDETGAGCGPVGLVDGEASCQMASTMGGHTLTALYSSNNIIFTDTTATAPHFVETTLTSVTITADAPDPSEVMTSFELDAHVGAIYPDDGPGPTGTVTFSRLDFNESCDAAVDASGNASCTVFGQEIGTQTWVASYSGDALYDSSVSDPETHTVSRTSITLTLFDQLGAPVTTAPGTFTVDIDSPMGLPSGNITIGDGTSSCTAEITSTSVSCDLSFAHAGEHELVATYDGDAAYAPAESEPITHFVAPAQTSVSIRSHLPEPSIPGQPVTVTVDAAVLAPGVGVPTGVILVSGASGQTECTIDASGGSCDLVFASGGPQQLEADFLANDDFDFSVVVGTHRVDEAPLAFGDNYASLEDEPLAIDAAHGVLANDQDPDGDPLVVVSTGTQTADGIGGTVTLAADGSFTYTPPPNANGKAVFAYRVSDGLQTVSADATITVTAVNDPPTFALASSPVFAPGTSGVQTTPAFATMTSSGPGEDDAPLAWHVRVVSDASGVLSAPATIALDGTLTTPLSGHGGTATLAVALQDDGGTDNGGEDTSAEQTFTVTVGDGTDLAIAIEDDTAFVAGGDAVAYRITVRNDGPENASGARVRAMLSANLVDAEWTCTADTGATCAAGGNGEIDDLAGIPVGARVVYTLTATTVAIPEFPAELDATVTAPAGLVDFNPVNDSASDVDAVGIFADGFDVPDAQREASEAGSARER